MLANLAGIFLFVGSFAFRERAKNKGSRRGVTDTVKSKFNRDHHGEKHREAQILLPGFQYYWQTAKLIGPACKTLSVSKKVSIIA